jgi:hypothetical protein
MKIVALISLLSFSALASDYTLYQAENEHFKDYSYQQLVERLGPNSSFLPYYKCDGESEHNLFWEAPRQNNSQDSLRVKLPSQDEKLVYKNGTFYNLQGRKARSINDEFFSALKSALKKIEAFPEGKQLLRQLERSYFPLTIVKGYNSFNPKEENGRPYHGIYMANALSFFSHGRMTSEIVPFHDIGVGGHIAWNPLTSDLPAHVALAHEMMHALDSVRGLLDMRFVVGDRYEFAFISEYRAVYVENLARKNVDFPLRTHYGNDVSGPGMLDENGQPIKMPSPCLK